ncbi:MAG: ABC transporter ATP-binding protein, partial [Mycobacterium sp.]
MTRSTPADTGPLLRVRGLDVRFGRGANQVQAVRSVDIDLQAGRILGLVGESGSGKSVTARSLIGLAGPGSRVSTDEFRLAGLDLTGLSPRQWRPLRGRRIGFVLQDALGSLDPVRRVEDEVGDTLRAAGGLSRTERRERVLDALTRVHLPEPERRLSDHAFQLSGGQRQRVLIASAIIAHPPILIADEPTTALDPRTQRHVLDLFAELAASGIGVLLVSHDLGAISRVADDIAVIHDGRIVESGPTARVLGEPQHSYTRALLAAIPGRRPVDHRPPRQEADIALAFSGVGASYPTSGGPRRIVLDSATLEV